MNIQESINLAIKEVSGTKALHDPTTINRVLASDTVFATIAYCAEITGPLKEHMGLALGGRIKTNEWSGIDTDNLMVGYLSHNNSDLRFQKADQTIFDTPLNQVKIEEIGLGLSVAVDGKSYAIGNFMPVNEQLSPDNKMTYNFGNDSTIWMQEMANLGMIDKVAWEKARNKGKRYTVVWLILVALFIIIFLYFGRHLPRTVKY